MEGSIFIENGLTWEIREKPRALDTNCRVKFIWNGGKHHQKRHPLPLVTRPSWPLSSGEQLRWATRLTALHHSMVDFTVDISVSLDYVPTNPYLMDLWHHAN